MINHNLCFKMVKRSIRVIFFYLLIPAIFIIVIYSFIFAKFSDLSQPQHVTNRSPQPNYNLYDVAFRANGADGHVVATTTASQELFYANVSSNVINTLTQYSKLDLNPNDTNFWSTNLEQQYQSMLVQSHEEKATSQFPLKVIIVPHSHNDPGWLNTYDQYFYRYTYYILDNMVRNLDRYSNMTFIWPEMSFFSRWWSRLSSDAEKEKLKRLLKSSRFEIVTGGWVMTDEGPAHYFDMLDQLIEGHQFLRTTLNYEPRNSWSIDPFGHSSTFPYLLQRSGIKNLYIQRTHFAWKRHLSHTQSLEFFWRQFFERYRSSSSKLNNLFCHMSPLDLYSYKYACGPDFKTCLEFDFRSIFGETSESTAVPLNDGNIDAKSHKIIEQYAKLGSLFSHNVALVLLGDDFRYNFDVEWQQQYQNYNFLMNYVNSNGQNFSNAHIQFGTLQDYFEAVQERQPIEANNYPSLYGDFLPYSDVYVNAEPNYWTGYFTTRPYHKRLSRELQHWLRTSEILYSLSRNRHRSRVGSSIATILDMNYGHLANARQNLALFQHHDGITGTSRDFVMEDYGRRMGHSIGNMMDVAAMAIQLLNADKLQHSFSNLSRPFIHSSLHKSNWNQITKRHILRVPAGDDGLRLLIFNSHTQTHTEPVRVLLEDPFIKLIDVESNAEIPFQINPVFHEHHLSSNAFELEFIDTLLPLSLKNYKVLTSIENIQSKVRIVESPSQQRSVVENKLDEAFVFGQLPTMSLENDIIRIAFGRSGLIESIHFKHMNISQDVQMSFIAYHSEPNESGAYLFKPSRTLKPTKLFTTIVPKFILHSGVFSSTLLVNLSDIAYSVKLYHSPASIGAAIHLDMIVDLENKNAYNNHEIVLRLSTPIRNVLTGPDGAPIRSFYIDSNGFQMLQRRWSYETGLEGNYYPMTSAIYIEDQKMRFTVLSASSLGATSPADGTVEIMLDRRILEDDKRGLSQGVTDNLRVEFSFMLVFEHFNEAFVPRPAEQAATLSSGLSPLTDTLLLQLNYPPVVTYSYENGREIGVAENVNYFANHYLIAPDLLCDYLLLNLRTLPNANNFSLPSNSSLMLLHNRASSSGAHRWHSDLNIGSRCVSSIAVAARQGLHLFDGLKVATIEACSLTGMRTLRKLESLAQMNIAPFEINSFNVTFA